MNKSDTPRVYIIYLQGVVFRIDYMFRLSSLGHHHVVSHYRGNYTIYGMIQYVNIKIIITERDLVLSDNIFFFLSTLNNVEIIKFVIKT
jgi:hypothetical protein